MAVLVVQEVKHTYRGHAMLAAHEDGLLEAVVNAEQRSLLLGGFLGHPFSSTDWI